MLRSQSSDGQEKSQTTRAGTERDRCEQRANQMSKTREKPTIRATRTHTRYPIQAKQMLVPTSKRRPGSHVQGRASLMPVMTALSTASSSMEFILFVRLKRLLSTGGTISRVCIFVGANDNIPNTETRQSQGPRRSRLEDETRLTGLHFPNVARLLFLPAVPRVSQAHSNSAAITFRQADPALRN